MKKAKCKVKGERLENYDAAEMNLKGPRNIFLWRFLLSKFLDNKKLQLQTGIVTLTMSMRCGIVNMNYAFVWYLFYLEGENTCCSGHKNPCCY